MRRGEKTKTPGILKGPGNQWTVRVTMRDPNGLQHERLRVISACSIREAEAERARLRVELEKEVNRTGPARETLRAYVERWIEDIAGRTRRSTAEHYARVLAHALLPQLGGMMVHDIGRPHVERLARWMERQTQQSGAPYSPDTVSGWWRVAVQVLRDAAADHEVNDPTYRVRAPRSRGVRARERRTLTAPELGALLTAAAEVAPAHHASIVTLALTGMRPGELFALTWDDVDFRGRLIHIRRAHRRGVVGNTKTDDPRTVAMATELVALLQAHRREMVARQHPGLEAGLVFPSDVGGYRCPEALHKPLKAAAEAAGLDQRVNAQVLRRTFNTLMVHCGVDRIVLRSQMGHCSEEMTERYAGVPAEVKHEAIATLGRLLTK